MISFFTVYSTKMRKVITHSQEKIGDEKHVTMYQKPIFLLPISTTSAENRSSCLEKTKWSALRNPWSFLALQDEVISDSNCDAPCVTKSLGATILKTPEVPCAFLAVGDNFSTKNFFGKNPNIFKISKIPPTY